MVCLSCKPPERNKALFFVFVFVLAHEQAITNKYHEAKFLEEKIALQKQIKIKKKFQFDAEQPYAHSQIKNVFHFFIFLQRLNNKFIYSIIFIQLGMARRKFFQHFFYFSIVIPEQFVDVKSRDCTHVSRCSLLDLGDHLTLMLTLCFFVEQNNIICSDSEILVRFNFE